LRVPAAGHVRAWNIDPAAYEAAVRAFAGAILESRRTELQAAST
jgi:hypothetical protein